MQTLLRRVCLRPSGSLADAFHSCPHQLVNMAIAFVRASTVSRSKGGAAAAALAYEACDELEGMDGSMYDFRNKASLETPTQIVGMECDLQELADKMELSETRKNSTVARRYIVALPHEISKEERADLALGCLEHLNQEYGVAGAVTVHEPDKGGDERNYHAHITISDRAVDEHGEFGKKVRVLTAMKTRNVELEKIKEQVAEKARAIAKRARDNDFER